MNILKISLAGSCGVALGLVWGGLWLALNFFAHLGLPAIEGVEGVLDSDDGVLRLAQVAIVVFLLFGTVAIAAALVLIAQMLKAPVALPFLAAFVTASLLTSVSVIGFLQQHGECSTARWLPLLFPCPS